jgi:hypothetical protein
MKLFMIISACQCPGVVRVNAEVAGGSNTTFVSWTIPQPNCPATLSAVSPPEARNGNGSYPIGKYDVIYNYEYSRAFGNFSLSCPVKITIKGKFMLILKRKSSNYVYLYRLALSLVLNLIPSVRATDFPRGSIRTICY